MEAPNNRNQSGNRPACFDVSPERLNAMDPAALEQAMEDALSRMTDETYDPAVIDAYLDALDRRTPMPDGPDAAASYAAFTKRVAALTAEREGGEHQSSTVQSRKRVRPKRRLLRLLCAAALLIACLLGTAVAAQAAGFDVFHAVARWTEDAFSFGTLHGELQPEFQEAKAAFAERGLPFRCIGMPEGFEVCGVDFSVQPVTNDVSFYLGCTDGNQLISFSATQANGTPTTIYEKDNSAVEPFVYHDVTHYIFHNSQNYTAAWLDDGVEYSIMTTGTADELKEMVRSIY